MITSNLTQKAKALLHYLWNSLLWSFEKNLSKSMAISKAILKYLYKSSFHSFNQLLSTYLLKFSPTLIFMCQGSESKTGSTRYFNWTRNFLAVIRAIATNLTFHGFFVKLIIRPFWDFNWLYVLRRILKTYDCNLPSWLWISAN